MPCTLKRHIPMLTRRHFNPFVIEGFKGGNQLFPCYGRIDNLINISELIGYKGIGYLVAVFFHKLFFELGRIFSFCQFFPVKYSHSSVRPITAISAEGHAKLKSPPRFLLFITIYAPP